MPVYRTYKDRVFRLLFKDKVKVTYEDGKEHAIVQMVEAAMKNLDIDLEKACQILDLSVGEYQHAIKGQISWKI